ncbi:MAG: hypothetical protein H6581_31775 [Bacteroidia bacterium]|nr:hypothetical protein [Bacteroidia bacterium]
MKFTKFWLVGFLLLATTLNCHAQQKTFSARLGLSHYPGLDYFVARDAPWHGAASPFLGGNYKLNHRLAIDAGIGYSLWNKFYSPNYSNKGGFRLAYTAGIRYYLKSWYMQSGGFHDSFLGGLYVRASFLGLREKFSLHFQGNTYNSKMSAFGGELYIGGEFSLSRQFFADLGLGVSMLSGKEDGRWQSYSNTCVTSQIALGWRFGVY